MRREQRSKLATLEQKESEVIRKLAELMYLSGLIICEGKTARQMVANTSLYDPDYLSFTYDARFFGLVSSQIEAAFSRMSELGLLENLYNVKESHPVHHARKLSETGKKLAKKGLELIKGEKLESLAAEVLSVTAVPIPISTAWGFYRAYIDPKRPDPLEKDVVEGRAFPQDIYSTISEDSVNSLVELFKTKYDWLVESFAVEKHKPGREYFFSFSIKPEGIRDRYHYLTITEPHIENMLAEFEKVKTAEKAKLLLMKYAQAEFPDLEVNRQSYLEKLLEDYGDGIAYAYVVRVRNKLKDIKDSIPREDGIFHSYHRILDKLLGTLAQASREQYGPNSRLGVHISVLPKIPLIQPAIASARVYLPEDIRRKVAREAASKKYHFGVDLHILHLPQILERLYLLECGQYDAVATSLLKPNSQ